MLKPFYLHDALEVGTVASPFYKGGGSGSPRETVTLHRITSADQDLQINDLETVQGRGSLAPEFPQLQVWERSSWFWIELLEVARKKFALLGIGGYSQDSWGWGHWSLQLDSHSGSWCFPYWGIEWILERITPYPHPRRGPGRSLVHIPPGALWAHTRPDHHLLICVTSLSPVPDSR